MTTTMALAAALPSIEVKAVIAIAAGALLLGLAIGRATRRASGPPPAPHVPPATLPAAVAEAIARGDKIGAIKEYRAATGCGLKDAKDVVDDLMRPR